MVVLHTGLLVGCAGRGVGPPTGRSCPGSAGRCCRWCWPRRRCAGGASRRSAAAGTPASIVVPGLPPVTGGPVPLAAAPQLRRRRRRGGRAAAGARAWVTAVVFTVLNAALLAVRIGSRTRRWRRCRRQQAPDRTPSVTSSSPAAARSGWPRRSYAPRAGLDVDRLEPRPAPIDKACGEGLMPGAVAALADLGVDPAGPPVRGIRYRAPGRSVAARRSGRPRPAASAGPCCTRRCPTPRRRAGACRSVGGSVGDVEQDARRVRAAGLRARLAGRRRRPALAGPRAARPGSRRPRRGRRRYGLRRHFGDGPVDADLVEVHWAAARGGVRDAGRPTIWSAWPCSATAAADYDDLLDRASRRWPSGWPGAAGRRRVLGAGPAAAAVAAPGGRPGAAGRRRGRLRRRADR